MTTHATHCDVAVIRPPGFASSRGDDVVKHFLSGIWKVSVSICRCHVKEWQKYYNTFAQHRKQPESIVLSLAVQNSVEYCFARLLRSELIHYH